MRLIVGALLLGLLGACMAGTARPPPEHGLEAGFWLDPPDCVVVLPGTASGAIAARAADRAFARHLSGRVAAVVGPDRRDAEIRDLALDLSHPVDRARYADLTGCAHGAELVLTGDRTYAVIWAEAAVTLKARLLDLATGAVLWRARYRTARGDGGLPASPLGFAFAMGRAGVLAADDDLLPSVLDDGLRALVATLPDSRDYATSRNSSVRPLSSRK